MRDGLLAAVLTLATQVELVVAAAEVEGPIVAQHLAFAVMTAAVALRRTAPVAATLVCAAGMAGQTVAGDAHLVDPVRAGAAGYLLKSMPPAAIRSALRSVARGRPPWPRLS